MADGLDQEAGGRAGELLRAARERGGLTVQNIADGLNLKPATVEALERGDFASLPPPTFVKGYYRAYARLLGVDETEVLALLERELPAEDIKPQPIGPRRPSNGPKWLLAALGVAVALLLVYTLNRPGEDAGRPEPVAQEQAESAESSAPVAEPEAVEQPQSEPAGDEPSMSEPVPVEAPPVVAEADEPEAAPNVDAVPPAEELAQSQPVATDRLVFKVRGNSWLEVRDAAGKRHFVGTVRGPEILEFVGQPPYSVVIGDVNEVEVEYQGRSVSLAPHTRGRVARLSIPASR